MKSHRTNTVIKVYKIKTCLLIHMAVLTDNNISVKEYNKNMVRI